MRQENWHAVEKAINMMKPTHHAKNMIAEAEYAKGKAFLGAAFLLRKHGHSEADTYVFLHLLCQAVELILKSVLLGLDYDRFEPQLANREKLGHKLLKIAEETIAASGMSPLKPALTEELRQLDEAFSKHRLRYASHFDILIHPDSISYQLTLSRIAKLVKIIERNGGLIATLKRLSHP